MRVMENNTEESRKRDCGKLIRQDGSNTRTCNDVILNRGGGGPEEVLYLEEDS